MPREARPDGRRVPRSIYELVRAQAERTPGSPAIAAPGRRDLTYAQLLECVESCMALLRSANVEGNDRVAVVLPNGPEMAVAFLGVAAYAACAPLNPAYHEAEFARYFADLQPKALIAQAGAGSPAVEAARARGIAVIELSPIPEAEAGIFTLRPAGRPAAGSARPAPASPAGEQDEAIVLHTSGTTSRPKVVPLTQASACASAQNVRAALELTPADRCLNVMPLFHIHGLVAAVLASLAGGGSVVCTAGFDADLFCDGLEATGATWYTAVPTMHQAILSRAAALRGPIEHGSLRFVRSCSSALPPQVMAGLEEAFGVPVVEAYGMTEAAHQIASNPLPPRARKPGSVGIAAGPEVAVMDDAGAPLPPGSRGEIVIRGANVFGGYENNPAANEAAFRDGWFRTGDEGFSDDDGYLYISGRLKEMINRGGEKVSPREVDDVLLEHPAVAQAVTFAVLHPQLGEDVAAAVVLREGASATESQIRTFAAERLAVPKLPRRVLIVDEIPKGPTGKVQRIGLGQRMAHLLRAEFVPPRGRVQERLAEVWAGVLKVERVGAHDDFFALGGSSLLAVEMLSRAQAAFEVQVSVDGFFRDSTLSGVAEAIQERLDRGERSAAGAVRWPCLLPVQPDGSRPPLFVVSLGLGWEAQELSTRLDPDQPVYSLRPSAEALERWRKVDARALAAHFIDEVRAARPRGPYLLAGGCVAGVVAYEMAQQFVARREEVPLVILLDVWYPPPPYLPDAVGLSLLRLPHTIARFRRLTPKEQRAYLCERTRIWAGWLAAELARRLRGGPARAPVRSRASTAAAELPAGLAAHLSAVRGRPSKSVWRYRPQPYPGRLALLLAADTGVWPFPDRRLPWRKLALGGCDVHLVPGDHDGCLKQPYVRAVARRVTSCITNALAARQRGKC